MGLYKFWLGVTVATFLSVAGWGVSNLEKFDENFYLFIAAAFIEIILLLCVYLLNKKVNKTLKEIRDFKK